MKKRSTKTSSAKRLKISAATRAAWSARDQAREKTIAKLDPDARVMPPEFWDGAQIGRFYRPIKTPVTFRADRDVLEWLKSKGAGHLTRINEILRERMLSERGRTDESGQAARSLPAKAFSAVGQIPPDVVESNVARKEADAAG